MVLEKKIFLHLESLKIQHTLYTIKLIIKENEMTP